MSDRSATNFGWLSMVCAASAAGVYIHFTLDDQTFRFLKMGRIEMAVIGPAMYLLISVGLSAGVASLKTYGYSLLSLCGLIANSMLMGALTLPSLARAFLLE
ncbi:MAG: hypothetical protein KF774_11885 [Planctomyces sp.]|nr:hypothetical protein [Planctomyces sp.]